ncbi:MAG: helix-turn-helix transcriptional regulator [Pseudomonadota bacterium]
MGSKSPNPVDVHVGSRLRLRRMIVGMSQEKLGEKLGLTFQQIQKYEKGLNRIGASRLFAISNILDAPVQYFFDDMPEASSASSGQGQSAITDEEKRLSSFLATPEGLQLNLAFSQIDDAATRRRLTELVRTLATESS